jgi:hypothetical protein
LSESPGHCGKNQGEHRNNNENENYESEEEYEKRIYYELQKSKDIIEIFKKSSEDPDNFGILHIMHSLFKEDRILKGIAIKSGINEDSILYVIK